MSSTATVTGKVGPAITMTAQTFTGVTSVTIETDKSMLTVVHDAVPTMIDIGADTTITVTKSGNNYTLTFA